MQHQSKLRLLLISITLMICLTVTPAWSTSDKISYQGILKDSKGHPISGSVTMTFTIYDSQTSGSFLWTETQTVTVNTGIYHVFMGEVNPLDVSIFNSGNRWLQVTVNGEDLIPRMEFSSAAFCFSAMDTNTLNGYRAGNGSGRIPVSNGLLNTGLNADMMDGVHASELEESAEITSAIDAHKTDASAHHPRYTDSEAKAAADDITTWGHTATVTNLNADMVDGKHSTDFASSGHNHDEQYYTKAQVNALIIQRSNGDLCLGNCN